MPIWLFSKCITQLHFVLLYIMQFRITTNWTHPLGSCNFVRVFKNFNCAHSFQITEQEQNYTSTKCSLELQWPEGPPSGTPLIETEPHAKPCIEIENHATLFSWLTWLAAWITGTGTQRRQQHCTTWWPYYSYMYIVHVIPSYAAMVYGIYPGHISRVFNKF